MKFTNEKDFLYMDNYKALLACIISEISVDKAVRMIALQKIGYRGRNSGEIPTQLTTRKRSYKRNRKGRTVETYVIDELDGKVWKFKTSKEAAEKIDVTPSTVNKAINKGTLVLKRYRITIQDPKKMN